MSDKHLQWKRMNDALEVGDFSVARDALDRMDLADLELLKQEMGDPIVGKLRRISRRRRGSKKGRVVVINGIMGAHLYSIDRAGKVERVWINLGRLFLGQLDRLELTPDGEQVKKEFRIEPRRLHKTYLPLAFELERNWDVLHFPFDWRLNMDREAARLADRIRDWAGGEPVHIVAHSMGGVLSRRFIQKFPGVWKSMADTDGLGRGGRLIMLGTPNKGSFIIPAMLTGKDKLVKILSFLDFGESKRRFLRNASSFPGGYQMLPSPHVDLQDDHLDLYRKRTWGRHRVIDAHLAMARRFQKDLDEVISAERLIHVAGYGIETSQRIEVKKPGKFRYEITRDGDGRVPHTLGLLEGVKTHWVQEKHGDLPLNDHVMDGIHDLLEFGTTSRLEAARPSVRSFGEAKWVDDEKLVELSPEEESALKPYRELVRRARSRGAREVRPTTAEQLAADAMFDDFLASTPPTGHSSIRPRGRGKRERPELTIEVVWGDIRRVRGDIYCVGHYEGVLPQRAEYALDTVVSNTKKLQDMVLRTHTQRGVLRGRLGDVNLYPWARKYNPPRSVAVAGMGRPGQFSEANLRTLARHLSWAVAALPGTETICTVLIGSGEGGLSTGQSVRGMIQGLADALDIDLESSVHKLRFVELYRDKALEIRRRLVKIAEAEERLRLRPPPPIRRGRGGLLTREDSLAYAAAALVDAATSRSKDVERATATILRRVPSRAGVRESVRAAVDAFAKEKGQATVEEIASRIRIDLVPEAPERTEATRISFWRSLGTTHVAALTNTAVKPERVSLIDPTLIDQLRLKLEEPDHDEIARFGSMLHRLLVPRDFRDILSGADSMVVEVDRTMSTVNWEMLTVDPDSSVPNDCIALRFPLARQLRTEYSPPPSGERASSGGLRALVVGDPGDPDEQENLPGAREEALRVAELLRQRGIDVTLRVGAPSHGSGPVSGVEPASRLEVLELLQTQRFDILHYAGHGDFQDEKGLRSGWLFKGGMLTAAELATVESPPRLIVANACLSARTSTRLRNGGRVRPEYGDAGLLPGLADEFLRRGARDYLGTAWEISDEGAIRFATRFYGALELTRSRANRPLGDALHDARLDIFEDSERYGALWAAYQHYGDPALML